MPRDYLEARRCEIPDCGKRTRENKPYCPDHVEEHPYVRALLKLIAERDAEIERIKQGTWLDANPYGFLAEEIIAYLRDRGSTTVARLARDRLYDSPEVVERVVVAMERVGLVRQGRSVRGYRVVSLVYEDPDESE